MKTIIKFLKFLLLILLLIILGCLIWLGIIFKEDLKADRPVRPSVKHYTKRYVPRVAKESQVIPISEPIPPPVLKPEYIPLVVPPNDRHKYPSLVNMIVPPPIAGDSDLELIKKCEAIGATWVMSMSPIPHCHTPELAALHKQCLDKDTYEKQGIFLWNALSRSIECLSDSSRFTSFTDDLKKECLSQGKIWDDSPYSSCISHAEVKQRDACLKNQGNWRWNEFEKVYDCVVPKYITECKAKGGHMFLTGPGIPRCMTDADLAKEEQSHKECIAKKGKWGPQGLSGFPGCVKDYADGGKSCQENTDCLGKQCLVDPTTKEHGKCVQNDSRFGCFSFFKAGANGLMGMCVD